jgi:hypothetical protein
MDRDTTTRTGARAPGVERPNRSNGGVAMHPRTSTQSEDYEWWQSGTKDGRKPSGVMHATQGKAPFDTPALEPYWGKPAVRNHRGDDGNVGIIRSPVRAIVPPANY